MFGKRGNLLVSGLFIVCLLASPGLVAAVTVPLNETNLNINGTASSIQLGADGLLYVLDDTEELWQVNPNNGEYRDLQMFGISNLADIAVTSDGLVWWSNNLTEFGTLVSSTGEINSWNNDPVLWNSEWTLNIGPIVVYDGKVWLASWLSPTFGLFQFDPILQNSCSYTWPGGVDAADLLVKDGFLWLLDWDQNRLLRFDPSNGNTVFYALGRDIQDQANLQTDGTLIWWAEDKLDGALVSFNPTSKVMTTFSLPSGSYPRNLALQAGKVWYADTTGKFGSLDPASVTGVETTLAEISLAASITPDCKTLADGFPFGGPPPTGTFTWTGLTGTLDNSAAGLDIFSLPASAKAHGIGLTDNAVWVADYGRQKLIKMDLTVDYKVFLPMLRR